VRAALAISVTLDPIICLPFGTESFALFARRCGGRQPFSAKRILEKTPDLFVSLSLINPSVPDI
jgi:hypothetical protein